MEKIWAIISHSVVSNTIVASQQFIDDNFLGAIRIDQLDPQPGIGWSYENGDSLRRRLHLHLLHLHLRLCLQSINSDPDSHWQNWLPWITLPQVQP